MKVPNPNPFCASGAALFRLILAVNVIVIVTCVWVYFYEYKSIPISEDEIVPLTGVTISKEWNFTEFASTFTCQHPHWCDSYYNDTEAAQAYLHRLQYPVNCSTARFLVFPYEPYSGLGSVLHIKGQFMGFAVHENRTFILPDRIGWTYGHACNPATFECYFMPLTHCNTSTHAPDWSTAPELYTLHGNYSERVVRLPSKFMKNPDDTPMRSQFVPEPFKHKDIYWWHAQVSKFVVRPNNYSKQIFEAAQKRVFPPDGIIPHPMISMYVRHGDKYKEATLLNFTYYMDIVMNQIRTVKHIYLGTDDPMVIDEALQNKTYSNFTFHFIETKRFNGGPLDIVNLNNGADLMNVSISDLYIQIQGDVFVGTRTSNWCRLIDELRKTSGKARVPYFTPEPPAVMFTVEK